MLKRLKNLWKISGADLTVNHAQQIRLQVPIKQSRVKKLASVVEMKSPLDEFPKEKEI